MLEGRGGNIGVSAGEDGVVLIDDQFAPLTDKIRAAVKSIADQPIRFVLNTHWHGDHTGGNESLGGAGAVIVAHDNVRKQMSVEHLRQGRTIPAATEGALPVVTFTQSVTFHLNGEEIHAIHVPTAHTDGDSMVHFPKANVLHMGDVFFNGMYPFIDTSTGGSVDGVIAAVGVALKIVDGETKIIAGHGPLSDRAELLTYRDVLTKIRDAVAPLVEAGKSLEEVQAAKPTAEFDEVWGGGFINPETFVGIVYQSLSH
jgi:glyoxylase-like metal-dependent hydrolase (beta-lactamase superfamily II)